MHVSVPLNMHIGMWKILQVSSATERYAEPNMLEQQFTSTQEINRRVDLCQLSLLLFQRGNWRRECGRWMRWLLGALQVS
jgi:hypothetical protein